MPTYGGVGVVTTSTGAQNPVTAAPTGQRIHVIGDFPIGADFPVVCRLADAQKTFGDWNNAAQVQGFNGPQMINFINAQVAALPSGLQPDLLVQRLGSTRASSAIFDANGNTVVTLYGIGQYAGSQGNKLSAKVTVSGSPTDQQWTLALSGTSLGGTFTLTLPGYGTTAAIAETANGATVAAAINTMVGATVVSSSSTNSTPTTGFSIVITAVGVFRGTALPNFSINNASITGAITSFTSTISTPGVRPAVTEIKIIDNTNPTVTLQDYIQIGQPGGTADLTSTASIIGAINGENPISSATSIVAAAPPAPSLSAPAATTQATATAVLSTGTLASITNSVAGAGYSAAPTVKIVGGGGTGATAHATISGGAIASYVVDSAGSGYTSTPTVVVDPPLTLYNGADGAGSAASVVTQTLLDQSLYTHADIVVCAWDGATVMPTIAAFLADGVAQGEYRVACLGPQKNTSFSALTSGTYLPSNNKYITMAGHDYLSAAQPGTGNTIQYDGFYLGAIYAGMLARAALAETAARWPVQGIKTIGNTGKTGNLLLSDILLLAQNNLMAFFSPPQTNTYSVYDAITTAFYQDPANASNVNPFYQLNIVRIDNGVAMVSNQALQGLLTRPRTSVANAQNDAVNSVGGNVKSKMGSNINGVNNVTATVDPNTLAVNVNTSYATRPPVTNITNTVSFTLS